MNMRRKVFAAAISIAISSLILPAQTAGQSYTSAREFPTGTAPVAVCVGDFNHDGKRDVAAANSGSANVSVLLGKGDGTFQATVNYAVGESPNSIVVADFNGDGKDDLAVANGKDGTVSILLGNGDGSFQPALTFAAGSSPHSLVVGDFNGDKRPDIAVLNPDPTNFAGKVVILLGNGDGTFKAPTSFDAGGSAIAIVAADFNGDEKLDLAVANFQQGEFVCQPFIPFCAHPNGNLSVFLGNGDGSFGTPLLAVNEAVSSVAVGDFNGDGKPDLALGFNYITVGPSVLLGNGDGTFRQPTVVSSVRSFSSAPVAISDMNGDGRTDLLAVSPLDSPGVPALFLYLGNGDGTFRSPIPFQPALEYILPNVGQYVSADLNGDGLPDVVLAEPDGVGILLNNKALAGADLTVGIGQDQAGVDQILEYTVVANNRGPQPSTNVIVTDTLPVGTAVIQLTANCTGTTVVACAMGDLPAGGTSWGKIVVYTPAAGGSITDSAQVSADQEDANPTNNTATVTYSAAPGQAIYTLTIAKVGNGTGVVNGTVLEGTGINCGSFCSQNFVSGGQSSLSATPNPGSAFTGWTGACTGTDPNNCVVTLNASETVAASFALLPDFSISPASNQLSVTHGDQTTDVLTISPQNGTFASAISLTCSVNGPAPMPSCSLSPSSVTPGANPTSSTLTFTLPAAAALVPLHDGRFSTSPYAMCLPGIAFLGFGIALRRSRRKLSQVWLLAGFVLALCAVTAGCGGGSTTPPPPASRTYVVTVTATTGSLQHSTIVTVNVN